MSIRDEKVDFARSLRASAPQLERSIWARLRAHRANGLKWRRQHPIGRYIADFYCNAARLVVEIDGASHRDKWDEDQARDEYMVARGLRVLRFDSFEFARDFDNCLSRILFAADMPEDIDAS